MEFYAWRLFDKVNLSEKKTHMWIRGPPNSGKSYFIEQLIEKGIRCYQAPYNNDWTGFDPAYHQVVYADEFKG
jgi:predicted AAA+ superfamily ATPase